MIPPTGTRSLAVHRVMFYMLATVMLLEVGCVSQREYERVKAETLAQAQALEAVQVDIRELDYEIAGLQASNRRDDAALSELQAAVQREEEQLPMMRQRAEATLGLLKTQVATLMNQSWRLARKIVDIRQESASLKTKVAHYKEEIEQVREPKMMAMERDTLALLEPAISEESIPSVAPTQEAELAEIAQAVPSPPALSPAEPAVSAPPVNVAPPQANDSWVGMIISWLTAFWNWLIS